MISREDIVRIAGPSPVGIELGVAEGYFSDRVLSKVNVARWYCVDAWAGDRGHTDAQYKSTKNLLSKYDNVEILRMRFDEALDLFEDNFFDFIYIDGYAHTGQEEGQTLADWWPKLKTGGIYSGDDYSPHKWPKNVDSINNFAKSVDKRVVVYEFENRKNPWSRYPSWYIKK